jgi:hypothetical protein
MNLKQKEKIHKNRKYLIIKPLIVFAKGRKALKKLEKLKKNYTK